MANTDDMRYVRTEQAIRSSFMELVAGKSVADVSVSAVCRHAGISRNAFYLHYSGMSELYASLVDEFMRDLRSEVHSSAERVVETGSTDYMIGFSIAEVFGKHEQLLRALLPADDGSLAKRLALALEQAYLDVASIIIGSGEFEYGLVCAFAAGAHTGMLIRWITETDRPITDAVDLFAELQIGVSDVALRVLKCEDASAPDEE